MSEKETVNFEEALRKLEECAQLLKAGTLSLEDSMKLYDESITYYNICSEYLNNAKQKIEKYNPQSGKTEPF